MPYFVLDLALFIVNNFNLLSKSMNGRVSSEQKLTLKFPTSVFKNFASLLEK